MTIKPSFREDILIFMGDYINRGPFPMETLRIVMALKETHPEKVVTLGGNHENWFLYFLSQTGSLAPEEERAFLLSMGACRTFSHFLALKQEEQVKILDFLINLSMFYENSNTIFSHIPLSPQFNPATDMKSDSEIHFLDNFPNTYSHISGKLVVAGHKNMRRSGVTLIGETQNGLLLTDTGAGMGGSLSAVNLDTIGLKPDIISVNKYRAYKGKLNHILAPSCSNTEHFQHSIDFGEGL